MQRLGSTLDEYGVIILDGGKAVFRREQGGRLMLEAPELRPDLIGRRVAIHGTLIGDATVRVERLSAQP